MLSNLHAKGVTILMVRNLSEAGDKIFEASAFMVDCIISMRYIEHDSKIIKLISIPKLRGSAHSNEIRQFVAIADGIEVGGPLD